MKQSSKVLFEKAKDGRGQNLFGSVQEISKNLNKQKQQVNPNINKKTNLEKEEPQKGMN